MNNKREMGSRYESLAASFLEQRGYRIVERNYRCHIGEIDLIAMDKGYLVFVEVKYRKTPLFGMPVEAVNLKKRKIISKVAQTYLASKGMSEVNVRFDIVAVLGDTVTVYENAFDFC